MGEPSDVDPGEDKDWSESVTLQLTPHPGLSESQRRAIELDYGMTDGTAEIQVRKSLLFYTLKRLGLDTYVDSRRPQDQQIVLGNASEIQSALERRAP